MFHLWPRDANASNYNHLVNLVREIDEDLEKGDALPIGKISDLKNFLDSV